MIFLVTFIVVIVIATLLFINFHPVFGDLDYPSIRKLKNKVGHFFVPYGVSNHLIRWGIPKENVTERKWWEEAKYQGLILLPITTQILPFF
ncbi:hypothetical protein ACF5W4_16300 [Bacillota bacterium Lsc_1132]